MVYRHLHREPETPRQLKMPIDAEKKVAQFLTHAFKFSQFVNKLHGTPL
jgi:hypothetical protein